MRVPAVMAAILLAWLPAAGGRIATIRYRGGNAGPVVFDHQLHTAKGFRCDDCHTNFARTGKALFFTRKQGLISFGEHSTAEKCFACHDGKGASEKTKNAADYDGRGSFSDCARCHRQTGGS